MLSLYFLIAGPSTSRLFPNPARSLSPLKKPKTPPWSLRLLSSAASVPAAIAESFTALLFIPSILSAKAFNPGPSNAISLLKSARLLPPFIHEAIPSSISAAVSKTII